MQELITYLLTFRRFTAVVEIESDQIGDHHPDPSKRGFPPEHRSTLGLYSQRGSCRAFFRDGHGNEITEYFVDEHNFVPWSTGNGRQQDSPTFRQAIMKTELVVFSDTAMEQLSAGIAGWDQMIQQIRIRARSDQEDRIRPTMAGDATACYKEFVDKYSQIASRIPLSYLASYLGITQQSLSRIRRQFAKKAYTRK